MVFRADEPRAQATRRVVPVPPLRSLRRDTAGPVYDTGAGGGEKDSKRRRTKERGRKTEKRKNEREAEQEEEEHSGTSRNERKNELTGEAMFINSLTPLPIHLSSAKREPVHSF